MKNLYICLILLAFSISEVTGQEIIAKAFYKNYETGLRTKEKKAKYIQTTYRGADGLVFSEVRKKKRNNDLVLDFVYSDSLFEHLPQYDLKSESLVDSVNGDFEPPFLSSEYQNFKMYIQENINYPFDAQEDGIDGVVLAQFVIDETGKICDVSIAKSVSPTLDREAARLIKESPDWNPAKLDGEPIKIMIEESFSFQLL